MLSSGLRSWQQENKYRVSDDTVYGVYENVGFSVAEEDGGRLNLYICYLRKKIETDGKKRIFACRGKGYYYADTVIG